MKSYLKSSSIPFQTLAALTGILESVADRRKSSPTGGDASTSSSSGGASTPPPSPSQNTDNEDSNHGEMEVGSCRHNRGSASFCLADAAKIVFITLMSAGISDPIIRILMRLSIHDINVARPKLYISHRASVIVVESITYLILPVEAVHRCQPASRMSRC